MDKRANARNRAQRRRDRVKAGLHRFEYWLPLDHVKSALVAAAWLDRRRAADLVAVKSTLEAMIVALLKSVVTRDAKSANSEDAGLSTK